MNEPKLFQQFKTDFQGTRKTERLISLEEELLKSVAVTTKYHVRPDLLLEKLNQLLLGNIEQILSERAQFGI